MTVIRIICPGLVAVFALCAVAASSASAQEVLFKLPAGGSYPVSFLSAADTSLLETRKGFTVTCLSAKNAGEILSAHLGDVEVTFESCTTVILGHGIKCQSAGRAKGEIFISDTTFHLGLAPGDKPAILLLLPENAGGEHALTFECGGTNVDVTGDVIGLLEKEFGGALAYNTPFEEARVAFEREAPGKQKVTEFFLSLTDPENELMTGQQLTVESTLTGTTLAGEELIDAIGGFSTRSIELVLG